MKNNEETSGFAALGLSPYLLTVLERIGIKEPTPIQAKSIPAALKGQDLIGVAQTGTGKTFAFGLPMLDRLAISHGQGLILLPTRELAVQVEENLRELGRSSNLKTVALIGGENIMKQMIKLRRNPHIIVATPGRLMDHYKRKTVKLNDVRVLVLDEADMMFDLGFQPQVEEILSLVPKDRQTMLFSATMPPEIVRLTAKHMKLPIHIEVAPQGSVVDLVDQEIYIVKREDKGKYLEEILHDHQGSILIFTRTKYGAKNLCKGLVDSGHKAVEIHSNLSFSQRREALAGFKAQRYRILIGTDVASRGIDVSGIELVVNYDLPDSSKDYVHRIGRTGRAGQKGKAISLATPNQMRDIKNIEQLINQSIATKKFATVEKSTTSFSRPRNNFSNRNGQKKPYQKFGSAKPRFGENTSRPSRTENSNKPYQKFKSAKPFEQKSRFGETSSRPQSAGGSRPYQKFKSAKPKFGGSDFQSRPAKSGYPKRSFRKSSSQGGFSKSRGFHKA
ncbi:MAG TPA: DEAD/DEAH box helicase [bacterium]|nr:DEAD/DEAH box helicase [bacterium]HPT29678.1 DEAD/DEAH box helicase [bacterium]